MNTDALNLAIAPQKYRVLAELLATHFSTVTPPGVTDQLRRIASDTAMQPGTVTQKYYVWARAEKVKPGSGLAALLPSRAFPEYAAQKSGLAEETVEYFRQLCIEQQLSDRAAFRKLLELWFAGEDIPGAEPGASRLRVPPGWSESNFRARCGLTEFERKAARRGLRAAAECRPLVYTSRSQMWLGAEYQLDDSWADFEAVLLGSNQRVRPLMLLAMDVYSSALVHWLIKPRVNVEGTRTNLDKRDMVFLLAGLFGGIGYAKRGTRVNAEAGTATIPEELAALLGRLSGGKIEVRIGQVSNAASFAGNYPGMGRGNFRVRALLEGSHAIQRRMAGDRLLLPSQTGGNSRTTQPEDLVGRQKETDLLLKTMPQLPDWVRNAITLPMPVWSEAVRALNHINRAMNLRGTVPGCPHEIEGFEEAGLVTTDFDLPNLGLIGRGEFQQRLAAIADPDQRAAVEALAVPRARTLSPAEVVERDGGELVKFRREEMALLLWHARREEPVKVGRNLQVVFEDKEISPSPLRFDASRFHPGDEFFAACNPAAPGLLFIYDARKAHVGRWVGVLQSCGLVPRQDETALRERIADAESTKHQLLARVRTLGSRITEQRLHVAESGLGELEQYAEELSGAVDAEPAPVPVKASEDGLDELAAREAAASE